MYTCSICNAQVKTRQGLAGHHRFRHEGKGYPSNYRPVEKDPAQQPPTQKQVLKLQKAVESIERLATTMQVRLRGMEELVRQEGAKIESGLAALLTGRLDDIEDGVRQIKQRGQSTEFKLDQFLDALSTSQETERRVSREAATAEVRAGLGTAIANLKAEVDLYVAEKDQRTGWGNLGVGGNADEVKEPERPNADPWLRNTPKHGAGP